MANPNLKRSGPIFKAQPKVLILCEDEKSGKQYITDAVNAFKSSVEVKLAEVEHPKNHTPDGLFSTAIKKLKKYEKIYCVFDQDKHTDFDKAVSRIKGEENGIREDGSKEIVGIVSYPCFEYWLLLHFTNIRPVHDGMTGGKSICDRHGDELKKQEGMQNYKKGDRKNLFSFLGGKDGEKFKSAMKNSTENLAQALGCPSLKTKEKQLEALENIGFLESSLDMEAMNPSTQIHLLMDILEKLSKPQLIIPIALNPVVSSVHQLDNYELLLTFANGEQRVFDSKPYLDKGVFKHLREPAFFARARVVAGSVKWSEGIDLSYDTLYLDSLPYQVDALEPA